MDHVRQDTLVAVFGVDELGEAQTRELRGLSDKRSTPSSAPGETIMQTTYRIRGDSRSHHEACATGDVHERVVAAGLDEQRNERPSDMVCSAYVDVPRLPPLVRVAVCDIVVMLEVSGDVDHDVDMAESLFDLLGSGNDLVIVGNICSDSQHFQRVPWTLCCEALLLDRIQARASE